MQDTIARKLLEYHWTLR